MTSLRTALQAIGIQQNASFSFRGDLQRAPGSLRTVIRATQSPGAFQQVSDIHRDQAWTDEVQGVAGDGAHWWFSCDANQSKPGHRDKALYTFPAGSTLKDGQWSNELVYWRDLPLPFSVVESDHHWGPVTPFGGRLYVAHFWKGGPKKGGKNVVIFNLINGVPSYQGGWIELKPVGNLGTPEFQAINPWDGCLYTSFGTDDPVTELFIHDPVTGEYLGRSLKLQPPYPLNVQGACFDGNGHLFVAVDRTYFFPGDGIHKQICYYSALNGRFLGAIPVLAQETDQELEGICFCPVGWSDGRQAQIHAVLLENRGAALDNIFFKSFSAANPAAM